eukprot:GHVO01029183.1.p1 GENE.GHVO01029183.1~~GHVO01029183.1.p1  ORF type:complete len:206 (+),score=28.76 GHVO01029183.1:71-688(+)
MHASRMTAEEKTKRWLLVVVGPSGVGKGTLIERLLKEYPGKFSFSVSHTSREPRAGEKEGQHYYFVSREKFTEGIKDGQFLEHAEVHGNYYGTSIAEVERLMEHDQTPLLEIDMTGAQLVRECRLGGVSKFVFVEAPSIDILKTRLRGRGSETETTIKRRIQTALDEMEKSAHFKFDTKIVNDDLDKAYKEFRETLKTWSMLDDV